MKFALSLMFVILTSTIAQAGNNWVTQRYCVLADKSKEAYTLNLEVQMIPGDEAWQVVATQTSLNGRFEPITIPVAPNWLEAGIIKYSNKARGFELKVHINLDTSAMSYSADLNSKEILSGRPLTVQCQDRHF